MTDLPLFEQGELNNSNNISPQPFPVSSNQQPSKKKNWLILSITAAILVIVGGFFVYRAYAQSPERIIKKMFINLSEVKTWQYSGEIKNEIYLDDSLNKKPGLLSIIPIDQNKKKVETIVDYNGLIDIQNFNNPRLLSAFNVQTDVLASSSLSLGLETRLINKFFYINITKIPYLGFVDLSFLKDQWIKTNTDTINQSGVNSDNSQYSVDIQEVKVDTIIKIAKAIQRANILDIAERLPNEIINGDDSYQYKFIFNPDGLKALKAEMLTISKDEKFYLFDLVDSEDDNENKAELVEGKIWIGKKDLLPRQISVDLIIRSADNTKILAKHYQTISLSNFNQPLVIDEPSPAKNWSEILKSFPPIIPGFDIGVNSTTTLSMDAEHFSTIDSDNDGLSDGDEFSVYGTDRFNSDTDGDSYLDGDEVKGGYNPNGSGKLLIDDSMVDKSAPLLIQ